MNSAHLLIVNGTVLNPATSTSLAADILVADGRVVEIAPRNAAGGGLKAKAPHALVIDAAGCYVAPGFIDMHVHLREPGQEAKETIATGSAAAVAGGFTTVCCMPNTTPALHDPTQIEYVYTQAARAGLCHVLPFGAITKDRKGAELAEMALMHEAGAIGFTDDGTGVGSPAVMLKALQYVKMFDGLISQHCEEPTLAGGAMNAGLTALRLGLSGMPAASEELMIARDLLLNKRINARYHVQHISTLGAVEMVRQAKKEGQRVTAEASPHHLLLTEEACTSYNSNTKMNPPLRTQKDVDAVIAGVKDGTIDCLATDHAPHTQEEKELEFDKAPCGIVGIETALPLYVKALVEPGHLTWLQLMEKMSTAPARVLGLKDKTGAGQLAAGSVADLVIIDPNARWTIDPATFRSKSRNTPFAGWQVTSKIKATIVAGRIVYGG